MIKSIMGEKTTLLLIVSLSVPVLAQQRITQQRELFDRTCEEIYMRELGNKTKLHFNLPINGLSCDVNAGIFYHCVPDFLSKTKYIEFCGPWIWVEHGMCPSIYLVNDIIEPIQCDMRKTKGCPEMQYMSYKYYKYPGCFSTYKNLKSGRTTERYTVNNQENQVFILLGFAIVITIIIFIIITFVYYKKWHTKQSGENTEELQHLITKRETDIAKPSTSQVYFRRQRAINAATKYLKEHKKVVITGKPGCGKTRFIQDMADEFKNLNLVYARHFCLEKEIACLFIIPCHWLTGHENIENLRLLMSKLHHRSAVIIQATDCFMQENENQMKEFNDCTINLSGEFKLTKPEKLEVIDIKCKVGKVSDREFTTENREKAADYECKSIGFLHLMDRLFLRRAFDNPVQFFQEEADKGPISRLNEIAEKEESQVLRKRTFNMPKMTLYSRPRSIDNATQTD